MDHETFNSATWVRARGRTLTLLLALATLVAAFAASNSTQASAADRQLSFSFDRGIINLGSTTGVKIIDPDLSPPDAPSTLVAPLTDAGTFTAPKSAFTFPVKRITNLETGNDFLPVVDAKIEISATADVTGTYDDGTDAATISIPSRAIITVYAAGDLASVAKCTVSGFSLDMATSGNLTDPATDPATVYDAAPFDGAGNAGAMVDNWDGLPASTYPAGGLNSQVCPAVDGLVGGEGGLWLSGSATVGGEVVPQAPTKAPKINLNPPAETSLTKADFEFEAGEGETEQVNKFQCRIDSADESAWQACDNGTKSYTDLAVGTHKFEVRAGNALGFGPVASYSWTITGNTAVCPTGTTGVPPNCLKPEDKKAKLAKLLIKPKNQAVKRGKNATVKVTVKSTGGAAVSRAKVCVTAPKKSIQTKKCVNLGQIGAGKAKSAKFKVTVKKKAKKGSKAVLTFKVTTSNAGSKSGKATIKVK